MPSPSSSVGGPDNPSFCPSRRPPPRAGPFFSGPPMTRHLSARRLTLAGLLIAGGLLVTMRPPMRIAFATIQTPTGRSLRVEIADTSAARARGLSGRSTLDSDGLLLTFPQAAPHAIWMKDMEFALDLIWLDAENHILAVIAHAPVCHDDRCCPLYLPLATTAARHVLELPAGRADAAGVEVGRSLRVQRR